MYIGLYVRSFNKIKKASATSKLRSFKKDHSIE